MLINIYQLLDKNNIPRYIGQTSSTLRRRMINHVSDAKNNKKNNHKINWLKKCFKENYIPKIELLEITDNKEIANKIEMKWINYYGRKNLVNSTNGGDGLYELNKKERKPRIVTQTTKDKISKSLTGINHFFYGKKHLLSSLIKKSKNMNPNKIIQFDLNNNPLMIYNSMFEIILNYPEFKRPGIYRCITGEHKSAYGYIFKYPTIEDINNYNLKYNLI